MPYVSMFFGIIIRMFHNDHNPPHFHAIYQGQSGVFDFSGNMIKGHLSSKNAQRLIKEWAGLHQKELVENWEKATRGQPINKIAPLN